MSAIGAYGSYGSMSGYSSVYQRRNTNPAGMEPVSPVSRAQTAPVPPVSGVPAVRRGAAQAVPEEQEGEFRFPTMREGADPAEMAVRSRIRYLDGKAEDLKNESGKQSEGLEKLLRGAETGEDKVKLPWEKEEAVPLKTEEGDSKTAQEVVEESECQTCKNRKYQDGSDEMVSFKSPQHISPESAASAVRAHEQEHVSNAYKKAAQKDGKVISASVSIHTGVCPECGRTYVTGGTTRTQIKYFNEDNPYQQALKSSDHTKYSGMNLDYAV